MFKNRKIGARLAFGFGIMMMFILILVAVGIDSINKIYQNLDTTINIENSRAKLANRMIDATREVSIELRSMLLDKSYSSNELKSKTIDDLRKIYDADFEKYQKMVPKNHQALLEQVSKVKILQEESRGYNDAVIKLLGVGDFDKALILMLNSARPKVQDWISAIDNLINMESEIALEGFQNSTRIYDNIKLFIFITGGIAFGLAFVLALLLTLGITKPLAVATKLVTTRDLNMDLSDYQKGADELSVMIRSFNESISHRIEMEEDMKEASQYARNLIEASLDPLVTISADGKITDVNRATVKVTGTSKEKLIGSDFADYFTEPDRARAGYGQAFSQGIVRDYPLTLRNALGGSIEVLYNASVYRNEAGIVQGVFAAARDISDRNRQENELATYRDQLEEMVQNRTADLLNLILEVKETVNVLAASSAEISAATSQVATGTAETATAITETSTTVEEVQQAAKLSAQKAKNVADSALQLSLVFQNGQKAVEETINGMERIREQMETIAQTVIRLSEQSQSIGGIIASVTDIADQSNLLAVNAAIEAAKAGEHGKGFAVVAQEIKNLAGQSKLATAQVRNILNDVQKATGAAVMATEQGGKAVESGVKQSMQAGEAIRILAESSNEAAQAATQIVASSQQQVVGMDQIGVAMQNINQAGTETAVSMIQAEKSAKSLYELGQKLKELINQVKV
jgi:PAS domain S-box-containing protein